MPAAFAFPPPPPPPPRTTTSVSTNVDYNARKPQHGRENGGFQTRGRGRGRPLGFQSQRGGNRLFSFHSPTNLGGRSGHRPVHPDASRGSHSYVQADAGLNRNNQKRNWSNAFASPKKHVPGGQAPPAVPSFGFQLPVPTPVTQPPAEVAVKPKRQNLRKHNRLGLTPRTEEHELTEEEHDSDEESRLAAALRGDDGEDSLQFEHKGQVTSLSSSTEIMAWIAERKKKFPTKARIAEALQQKEKVQQEENAAKAKAKQRSADMRAERQAAQMKKASNNRETKTAERTSSQPPSPPPKSASHIDFIQKKADELRRQLAMVEQELALSKSSDPHTIQENPLATPSMDTPSNVPERVHKPPPADSSDSTEWAPLSKEDLKNLIVKEAQDDTDEERNGSNADGSSGLSDAVEDEPSDDEASSVGSSSTDDPSEDGPEEESSKLQTFNEEAANEVETVKVNPTCQYFTHRGSCRYGESCKFSHDPAQRDQITKGARQTKPVPERITLYERLMKRQQQEENEELLRFIMAFGARGYFESR